MTRAQFLEFHDRFTFTMRDIVEKKNQDYTAGGEDAFSNFTRIEALGICSTEQGFLTRMTDKLCRLGSFVQKGHMKVSNESAIDTLIDLSNYCSLLAGFLYSKLPDLHEQVKAIEADGGVK